MSFSRQNIWIDTGGTFTDCLTLDPEGQTRRVKVLSSSSLRGSIKEIVTGRTIRVAVKWDLPEDFISGFRFYLLDTTHPAVMVKKFDPVRSLIELDGPLSTIPGAGSAFEVRSSEEAPVLAARLITGTPMTGSLSGIAMRLATTRGTNALLERRGAGVALFITSGFGDLLRIGNQQRPDLFDLRINLAPPLYRTIVEVPERIAADGTVIEPLRLDKIAEQVGQLAGRGITCAAVAFMNSYLNPSHEQETAEFLLDKGLRHVSCSSKVAPFIKILPRAETAVVDSYLSPIVGEYLDRVRGALADGTLHVMTSAGGVVNTGTYNAKDSLLSGPAGGVVGAALAAQRSGYAKIISFDMGGTSTDVARYDGDYDYVFEHEVGDAHLVAPALAIESVAAGGGSICCYQKSELCVGPESAGANPGPACYGAGGPLTLTDVNLLLGRLDESRFEIPIDSAGANRALDKIITAIEKQTADVTTREKLLEGFCDIANERMADAVRRISIRRGYDPRNYALVAFGGAGGQHACSVAENLSVDTVVIPPDASLLSALGLGHAVIERFAEKQVLKPLSDAMVDVSRWIQQLEREARAAVEREGVAAGQIEIRRRIINMRFAGQDSVLQIELNEGGQLEKLFETKYRTVFGHWQDNRPIEIESVRVAASSRPAEGAHAGDTPTSYHPTADQTKKVWVGGEWRTVGVFEREGLAHGARIRGPALVVERYTVTVVENAWEATVDGTGALVLKKKGKTSPAVGQTAPEIVRLELFTNRLENIAREMGEMLRRTAVSTNIKERLDFSCAVLDKKGELVVNAPHIPVHLGAMGLCARAIKDSLPLEPGDVVVTNHPGYGGSHLPDVTVLTPVFAGSGELVGYTANRAHHAEIGGTRPGSMPPAAAALEEEGAVIPPTYLFKSGEARWEELHRLLSEARYPSRAVEENLADVRAAVAANRSGADALIKLAREHGTKTLFFYMAALKKRAESRIRAALDRIPDGLYEAEEKLDDGSPLRVKIAVKGDEATVDFSGSAGVHPGSLNTTPAVVNSVVIYVLRLLVNEPLPLNEGLMQAVTVCIPPGILNPPFPDDPSRAPAIVGGNVETSQRLADVLIRALKLAACSQGTMNNVLFGTDRYSYYETVGGGTGAGPGFEGTAAVHSHMTNTRITDPEIIEHRYPVRVDRFEVRTGSGGAGEFRGGDGVIREFTFLEKMSLSVLGQHRKTGPYGMAGGEPGATAVQRVVRASGETIRLDSVDACEVGAGDRLITETPGGGGYGKKTKNEDE